VLFVGLDWADAGLERPHWVTAYHRQRPAAGRVRPGVGLAAEIEQ
jgi:hypothetical protein